MIKVNYKITVYNNMGETKTIDNLSEFFDENILFPDMIDTLVEKNNINHFQIYVEDLKENTWGKKLDKELYQYISGDDFHYQWFNYKLSDIDKAFNLFNEQINIVIDGPGIGGYLGEDEGISFYINNNEKDRHEFEPHVHCKYSGEKMRIRIDTLQVMKKDKIFTNRKKVKKAIRWINKHQQQLLEYYNSFAINGDNSIKFEAYI